MQSAEGAAGPSDLANDLNDAQANGDGNENGAQNVRYSYLFSPSWS